MGRAILHHGGRVVAALACGYLGLLASALLLGTPLLLASAISGSGSHAIFASDGFVQILGRPVGDLTAGAHSLYRLGPALFAIMALASGPFVVGRLTGYFAIVAVHLVYWCGVAFSEWSLAAGWGRGPVSDLARFLTVSQIGSINLQMPLALLGGLLAGFLVYLCVARIANGGNMAVARVWDVSWRFVIPVIVLALLLPSTRSGLWQRLLGIPHAPAIFAAVIAAIAIAGHKSTQRQGAKLELAKGAYVVGLACIAGVLTLFLPDWVAPSEQQPVTELGTSAHWALRMEKGAVPVVDQSSLLEAADRRVEAAAERLGIALPSRPLQATVRSTENRTAWFRGRRQNKGRRETEQQIPVEYRLMPSGSLPDARIEPRLLMAAWADPGYEPLANAIARFAVGDFLGRPLGEYARRIACEEGPYSLHDVLDLSNEYLSPIVRDALGGAWIESLRASADTLKRIYSFRLTPGNTNQLAAELGTDWYSLEATWKEFLTDGADCAALPVDPPLQRIAWHKGVSFSHEVGGGWGYGSDSAASQLDRIRSIGANSVAIIPYAFSRAPEVTSISFRTDETDERVVRTIEQAHHEGLAAVLKPQIWARQFTGDIKFASREDFDVWFAQYRRWLLHFARMGALNRAEMLVIGTELGGMTGYEDAWRGLIADIRAIYPGELAYAANWNQEFEVVRFWDALDYVSVNFYFPLSDGERAEPSPVRLEQLAALVERVATRYGKPALFTEVGYPSVSTAAQQPWLETAAALDPALQRDCYEAVFQTFANRPWFAGFYWWKWPSHGTGGVFDESFSPLGKPALEELTKWYRGEAGALGRTEAEAPIGEGRGSAGQ